MVRVRFKQKSFIGFILGVLLVIFGIIISDEFKLSVFNSIVIVYGSFFTIYLLGYVILKGDSNQRNEDKSIDRLIKKLEKISDTKEIERKIIQTSKKREFGLQDIRWLMYHFKLNDEFWIDFFNTNNFTLTNTHFDGIDLRRILESLNSKDSRIELLNILVRKGKLDQGEFRFFFKEE